MRHPDELIRRFLDGDLAPVPARALRDHLAGCDRCRQRVAALQRLDARLRALDRPAPPRDLALRVRAQIVALPPPRRPTPWPLALAFLLALVGLLGMLVAAEELLATSTGLLEAANGTLLWTFDQLGGGIPLYGGAGLDAGALGWIGGDTQLVLVIGLCLVGIASALVLRQSLTEQIEPEM